MSMKKLFIKKIKEKCRDKKYKQMLRKQGKVVSGGKMYIN